ncbi:MAG: hypothetical protein ABI054_03880 [Planctomycetota bacterium]
MAKNRKVTSTKTTTKTAKGDKRTTSEVEVVEEKKGMGWEGGVAVFTTLVLLAACLCVDYDLGHKYAAGMFFK